MGNRADEEALLGSHGAAICDEALSLVPSILENVSGFRERCSNASRYSQTNTID